MFLICALIGWKVSTSGMDCCLELDAEDFSIAVSRDVDLTRRRAWSTTAGG